MGNTRGSVSGRAVVASRASEGSHRAGLVVQKGPTETITACVRFDETTVDGLALLRRAGLDVVTGTAGGTVCKIDNTGCPADSCFTCTPNNDYWSYWQLTDGDWAYATTGAGDTRVSEGDVEGWRWGQGTPPLLMDFNAICGSRHRLYLPILATTGGL